MSRITISEAAKQFGVSRPTIYKKINTGELTKDADGKVDIQDCIRVLTGVNTVKENKQIAVNSDIELLKKENGGLQDQVYNLKQQVTMLLQQLEYAQKNESWLKQQIEQLQPKRIEHKKSLIGRLFG